jgi:hypothetical protein
MTRIPTVLLSVLALTSCGKTTETGDTSTTETTVDCSDPSGAHPIESGTWAFGIDEALYNYCENAQGHGVHIHVGENTNLDIVRDGSCVTATDEEFVVNGETVQTVWEGQTDGNTLTMTGWVEIPIGTCWIGITPVLTGTMTSTGALEYEVSATVDVAKEGTYQNGEWVEIPDACDIAMGDETFHSLPLLPCEQGWVGSAGLID